MRRYVFWPAFWVRTVGPTHWPPESWGEVVWIWDDWSLVYVSAVRIAPAGVLGPGSPTGVAGVADGAYVASVIRLVANLVAGSTDQGCQKGEGGDAGEP